MYTKKGKPFVLSRYLWQGKVAPPLTSFVIYPICFTAYTFCDLTSQLFSLKVGGASDPKKQTLALLLSCICCGCQTQVCLYMTEMECNLHKGQGQDSPSLKLYYLSLWLSLFQWKTLLVEKTVIVELGESRPCKIPGLKYIQTVIYSLYIDRVRLNHQT